MAKEKIRLLGTVVKVYDSNIVETDSGNKVTGKFEKGSILIMNLETKEISVQEKKTNGKQDNKQIQTNADTLENQNNNTANAGANTLKDENIGENK